MRVPIPHNTLVSLLRLCGRSFAAGALVAAAWGGAQTQTPPAAQTAQAARAHKPVHAHKKHAPAATPVPAVPVVAEAAVPALPAEPAAPVFPINDKPTPATITWDSQGLRIEAANSSLEQIMKDVSTAIGAQVEGLDTDQRVFGAFGPGPARDVLSQLLLGSGYNVLMIGDQGQGTPRRMVLSSPHPGSATPAAAPAPESDEETEVEEQPLPIQPTNRPGFPPGMQGRTPQQMQEFQQRQQMMQQRGQPGQPVQPQPPAGPQN
jgi:hypothetical protein